MRNCPFLDRKPALARLLRNTEAGILLNEHIAAAAIWSKPAAMPMAIDGDRFAGFDAGLQASG
jgi:hypothetical protein